MDNPVSKAKWILETKGVTGIPAESLEAIAESEGIICCSNDYPDDNWDGMLLWKGTQKAILVNTHWGKIGKHNFSFAHELGHYFLEHPPSYLKNGQFGFCCILDSIDKDRKTCETEANRFAVELLMPEDRFRFDMIGSEIDFTLIASLSRHYIVSKHACSNRILSLTSRPCVVILTKGQNITGYSESRAARGFLMKMKTVPDDTTAYYVIANQQWQNDFVSCNAKKWLIRTIPGDLIYECTHIDQRGNTAMTILKW